MKKVLRLFIALILSLVIGFLYFRTTPQYTLVKLVKAYKTHDVELAKQYMDIDGLAIQAAEEAANLMREEINKPSETQDEWESFGEGLANMFLEGLIPSLKKSVEEGVKKTIIESIEGIEGEKVEKAPAFEVLTWRDLLPGGKITVKKEGVLRLLTISDREGELFTFRMKKEDKKWKIVKWENFGNIVKDFTSDEIDSKQDNSSSKKAVFGDRVDINTGWFLIVNTPEEYSPSSVYDQAEGENKLVTIEVIYENTSNKEGTYDAANFELKDDEDHRYKREYSGKKPELDYSVLPSGEKVKGFITYEIPNNMDVVGVIYSSSGGGTISFEASK